MGMTGPDETPAPGRRPIAPLWHTIALVALILAIAGYGAYLQKKAGSKTQIAERRGSTLPLYLGLIAGEWALFRFSIVGLRKTGTRMRGVIGQRWASWKDVARDAAIGLGAWVVWTGAETLLAQAMGQDTAKEITALLPRGPAEIVAWIALSVSAGICEEAVFRGYLQQQFQALTGNTALAISLQALVFGVGHGYQGLQKTLLIVLFGAAFGALAHWRRSLKPGMILHAWTDIFSGILASRA